MTETRANGESTTIIDEGVYWMSQPKQIPSNSSVMSEGPGTDEQEDLAATPTPQRPIMPRSLTIPETVDENSPLVTDANNVVLDGGAFYAPAKFAISDDDEPECRDRLETVIHCGNPQQVKGRQVFTADTSCPSVKPKAQRLIRSSSTAASSPHLDSASEDELQQIGSSGASALTRFMSSSPPCGSVAVRRGSSGGVPNAVVARASASKPLRTSSSATHLPQDHSSNIPAAKCASPFYSQHPSYTAVALNSQMSDTESIGSSDSIQDLSVLGQPNGAPASGNLRWIRHSSTGSAFYPVRGSLASNSCSPSTSICSVRTSFNTQGLNNHLQNGKIAHVGATTRSFSTNFLEDELLSRVGTPVPGSSSPFGHDVPYVSKHLHTEKVVSKHSLKGRLSKLQRLLDRAFALMSSIDTEESIVEGCAMVTTIMINAWMTPKIGHDLAYGLCDYLRELSYLDTLLNFFLHPDTKLHVRLAAGRAVEECLSAPNRSYIAADDFVTIDRFVDVIKSFKDSNEEVRMAISLLESLFKHNAHTNAHLIDLSALDYILTSCKTVTASGTLKHAALALANLAISSDAECRQRMVAKKVPDWLFFLASNRDDVIRYYACLSACILVSNKEIEAAVIKSGTLSLVEQFLLGHKPADFATSDYKNIQGRPRPWLEKLVPVLNAKRRESRAMAAFHFAMEAGIKRDQERTELFHEIGAVEALKQVAALPEDVAPKFATMALEIIGAEVPHKLSPQVPLWSVEDVQYWVNHIGFEKYACAFSEQRVDGDLLLLLDEAELEEDIGMKSNLMRRRFMRELEDLKMAADYTCVDETQLDRFLVSIDPHFSIYTYQLLELGVDKSVLPSLTDDLLRNACGIENPIHRLKIMKSVGECKHLDDMEVAMLSKHIDIFISYRRSTGNQLASLIKVLLQLRGYKVFIDVDRLYAGKFDCSLLKNIQAAKHFILVLTPHALDRCMDDDECNDWLHKELLCAIDSNKNIIPVFDPHFEWPDECRLPNDVRAVTRFNGVRWIHEYQEACVDKLEKFIEGELNIDHGVYPSPPRPSFNHISYYPGSKANSISSAMEGADVVLDALNAASRGRRSSQDQILNDTGPLSPF